MGWQMVTGSCYCKVSDDLMVKFLLRSKKSRLIDTIRYWLADRLEPSLNTDSAIDVDSLIAKEE